MVEPSKMIFFSCNATTRKKVPSDSLSVTSVSLSEMLLGDSLAHGLSLVGVYEGNPSFFYRPFLNGAGLVWTI